MKFVFLPDINSNIKQTTVDTIIVQYLLRLIRFSAQQTRTKTNIEQNIATLQWTI